MGSAKRMMEERQEQENNALAFLVEVGCIEECENHDGIYFDGGKDIEDAYRAANAQITRGTLQLYDGMTRRMYTDLLKSVYDDNSGVDSCHACDKIRNSD